MNSIPLDRRRLGNPWERIRRQTTRWIAGAVAAAAFVTPAAAQPTPTFIKLAGSAAVSSHENGNGSAASFLDPSGMTRDASGNFFVVDSGNHVVRKITSGGVVTTFAGTPGLSGSADGVGAAARFNLPHGIAGGTNGDLFVTDAGNGTVRKITAAGVVTTLAGTPGTFGSADGAGAAASFSRLGGLAVDPAGNVYVADTFNNAIRRITPAGVVSVFAGSADGYDNADGIGTAAVITWPTEVASDSLGNLYVSQPYSRKVRKITPQAVVTTYAGWGSAIFVSLGGLLPEAFTSPGALVVGNGGNLFVLDGGDAPFFPSQNSQGATIQKVAPDGTISTVAGSVSAFGNADGQGSNAKFRSPSGITVDGAGNLFVADSGNRSVRRVSLTAEVTTFAGGAGEARALADERHQLPRGLDPRDLPAGMDRQQLIVTHSPRLNLAFFGLLLVDT